MERQELLTSISETVADYRQYGDNQITKIDEKHVDRWISQFEQDIQLPLLRGVDHILARTYISKPMVESFLDDAINTKEIYGEDQTEFWTTVQILDTEQQGNSQRDLNELLKNELRKNSIINASSNIQTQNFIYLDDAIFTGRTMLREVANWIKNSAPPVCRLTIMSLALFSNAFIWANRELQNTIKESGKQIKIDWRRKVMLYNDLHKRDESDVLWPKEISSDAAKQLGLSLKHQKPRSNDHLGTNKIFSSGQQRALIEDVFTKKGIEIIQNSNNFRKHPTLRPLGSTHLQTMGFGSVIATYRNCPNNNPLVFWAQEDWYPLFPRKTNSQNQIERQSREFKKFLSRLSF